MEGFEAGQEFVGEYPPEAAEWCNANGCAIEELASDGVRVFRIVEAPAEYGPPAPPDPAPSREELAAAVAELGDMLAEERQRNDELSEALMEIGDMVAVMAAGEE